MPFHTQPPDLTQDPQRSPNRALLRAVSFADDDSDKPIIGIANGFSTITPAISTCASGPGAPKPHCAKPG